jgi:hypothetical protein
VTELLRLLNSPCRDIARLVSAAQDTELTRAQRWAVRIHLLYCRACRAYRRHLVIFRQLLQLIAQASDAPESRPGPQDRAARPTLSPEARQRIQQALRDA